MKNDLTEKEVLRFFNNKKQELQKELEKVEMAISALGGSNIAATPPAVKEKVAAKKTAAKREVARTPKAKKRLEKRFFRAEFLEQPRRGEFILHSFPPPHQGQVYSKYQWDAEQ